VSIFSKTDQPEEKLPEEKPRGLANEKKSYPLWLIIATWVVSGLMIALTAFSLYQYLSGKSLIAFLNPSSLRLASEAKAVSALPTYAPEKTYSAVERAANSDTVLPSTDRTSVVDYKVESGDSIYQIAEKY
jgi:hypothetical protein